MVETVIYPQSILIYSCLLKTLTFGREYTLKSVTNKTGAEGLSFYCPKQFVLPE